MRSIIFLDLVHLIVCCTEYNSHLDDEVVAEVEGPHCVDQEDLLVMVETDPRDALQQFRLGGESRQHLDLFCMQDIGFFMERGEMSVKSKIVF